MAFIWAGMSAMLLIGRAALSVPPKTFCPWKVGVQQVGDGGEDVGRVGAQRGVALLLQRVGLQDLGRRVLQDLADRRHGRLHGLHAFAGQGGGVLDGVTLLNVVVQAVQQRCADAHFARGIALAAGGHLASRLCELALQGLQIGLPADRDAGAGYTVHHHGLSFSEWCSVPRASLKQPG
jgi:hypothetical protein